MVFISLARSEAPNNSNRGMLCFFIGVSLVFDATRRTSLLPLFPAVLRYTTAAYALSEASLNPCNSKEVLGLSCVE